MIAGVSFRSARPSPPIDAAAWRFALADGALVLLIFAVPHAIGSDGLVRFYALAQLLTGGGLAANLYSLIGPLFSTPLYVLGTFVYTPAWWCAAYNVVLVVGCVSVLGFTLQRMAGRGLASTFVLVLAMASMFPNHVRNYYGEVFTAVMVAVGLLALATDRLLSGAVLLALGVANTPATAAGLLVATSVVVWDTRRIRYAIPFVLACVLIMGESWLRRGGPFTTGYLGTAGNKTLMPYSGLPGFSYPLGFGLLSVLFSFGKGLVFFAPGLMIPLAHDVPDRVRAWWRYSLWFLAGCVLVYSKWWAWFGGWAWGPRFFLFASVPASLTLAAARERYRTLSTPRLVLLAAALALSTWVAIDGGTFELANLDICLQNADALHFLCWYVPEFSALWRPFVAPSPLSPTEWLFAWYCAGVGLWLIAPMAVEIVRRIGAFVKAEGPARLREVRW